MAGLMLRRSYTLFIAPTGYGWYLQHSMMRPSIYSLEGTVYAEFSNYVTVGPLRNRMSLWRLMKLGCRGTQNILVRGHRHPLRTSAEIFFDGVSIVDVDL